MRRYGNSGVIHNQNVDMWRSDIYERPSFTRSKYNGCKQYVIRCETEIDNGQYVTQQESPLFGGEFEQPGNVGEFSGSAEECMPSQWRVVPGTYVDGVFGQQFCSGSEFGRRGTSGESSVICERSTRLLKSRGVYGPRTDSLLLARGIVERVKASCRKREIIRSVVFFNGLGSLFAICEKLSARQESVKGPNIRIAAIHWENESHTQGHVHIVHDCNPNRGQCRCSFLKGCGLVHHAKGTKYANDFSTEDIVRLFLYFCSEERELAYLFVNDRRTAIPSETALLQIIRHSRGSGTRSMEEELRGYDSPFWSSERCPRVVGESIPRSNKGNSGRRWVSVGKKSISLDSRMRDFILEHLHVPLDSIVRSEQWLNSEFRFIRTGNKDFQNVCDTITAEWVHYSLEDLYYFWNGKPFAFWNDEKWLRINGRRYDVQESTDVAEKLLLFQFGAEDAIKSFLEDVVSLLDRRNAKKHCLETESPPSAGKNYFFDPIFLFMGSMGQIGNANRNNMFAFDNCFNKRVLLFNEPRFENSFREQLLMLFAGDKFSAQGKYKNIAEIVKTPVVVLTNSSPFPNAPCWNDRMYRYRWRRCDFLKEHKCLL